MKKIKQALAVFMAIIMLLTMVPSMAFAEDDALNYLKYEIENDEVTITGYKNAPVNLSIPSEIEGKPVTSIGGYAFYDCSSLQSITIPDSVTSIGDGAFSGCSSLQSITIPDSVTSIGNYVFSDCSSLQSIIIPNSVTSIGDGAFFGCSSLQSITIPDSVISIGGNAFYDTAYYNNESNWENGLLYIGNHLIDAKEDISGDYIIKDGTKIIAGSAFEDCRSLESITIPDSVTIIAGSAFEDCRSLQSITIPGSVTSIGNCAFEYCSLLASITIPDSVTSIGSGAFRSTAYNINESNWENGVLYIGNHLIASKLYISGDYEVKKGTKTIAGSAFEDCTSLRSITIPDSVTSIGEDAFYNCSSLQSITIPDSVTSIGKYAFYSCSSLQSITIPDSVTSIGEDAFYNCSSLQSITILGSVASIGSSAFYDCSSLQNITIPDSVTSIGDYAFYGCSALQSITIPDSVSGIGYEVFSDCSSLQSITIPDSVTSIGKPMDPFINYIGKTAFSGCSSLVEINIDENNEYYSSVDGVLFNKNKTHLIAYPMGKLETSYTILGSVTNIGDWAFEGCSYLQSIIIPETVTSIGLCAFNDSSNLSSITIPDSLTSIGGDPFFGKLYFSNTAFDGTAYYNNESNWENGVLYIGNHLIRAKEDISGDYTIKDGTKTIAVNAFCYCSNLSSITIPDSVTSIGNYVFSDCRSLQSITIPGSVTSIGDEAFYVCSSLATVNYGGTEEQWKKINIGENNEALTSATINFALSCAHANTTTLPAVPATCTEKGMTEGQKCEDCGEIITAQTEIPATGHTFGEWTIAKEATYSADGEKSRKCSACDFAETEVIAKLEAKNEAPNSDTNVVIKYDDGIYDGKLTLDVKKEIEGESVNIVIKEKGEYKSVVFDITPTIDGKKVQPNGKVLVGIPLPDGYNKDSTFVYFVGEDGLEKLPSYYEDGKIWFETNHFSAYALVDESEPKEEPTTEAPTTEAPTTEAPTTEEPEEPSSEPEPSFMLGDINGDNKITATDARLILRISARLEKLEDYPNALLIADTNGDGKLTAVDARKVLRVATRLDSFDD